MMTSEPNVGPNSIPASEVHVLAHLGPIALCSEHFNVKRADPARHDQYFVCRRSHMDRAMVARASRRWFTG